MDKKKIARLLGSLGGQATVKKYGKAHMANAGKIGMAKRWAGHTKKLRNVQILPRGAAENFATSEFTPTDPGETSQRLDLPTKRGEEEGRKY